MKSNRIYFLIIIICAIIIVAVMAVTLSKRNAYLARGERVYKKHCENCHGVNGEGLQRLIPPLNDLTWLESDSLACIIKYGIDGPIEVSGITYNSRMPSNALIENDEIADVISYIRFEFGHIDRKETIKTIDDKNSICR